MSTGLFCTFTTCPFITENKIFGPSSRMKRILDRFLKKKREKKGEKMSFYILPPQKKEKKNVKLTFVEVNVFVSPEENELGAALFSCVDARMLVL